MSRATRRSRPLTSGDTGFTLIEMTIALFMVALASLGALGVFVASAKAQKAERSHSQAVRLATSSIDNLRAKDICTLTPGTTGPTSVGTYNGITFNQTVELQAVSSTDLSPLTLCSSFASVVKATTTISWQDGTNPPASVKLATILGNTTDQVIVGPAATASASATSTPTAGTPVINTPVFNISPLTINRTTSPVGYPNADEEVTVAASGFTTGDIFTGSYTDDDGPKSFTLTSPDGLIWRGTIAAGNLHRVITNNQTLNVTVRSTSGVTASGALALSPEVMSLSPIAVSSATVHGSSNIQLRRVNAAGNGGENDHSIAIVVDVANLTGSDPGDYVKVSFPLRTGGSAEIALTRQPTGIWTSTIPNRSQKIAPGAAPVYTDFTVTAYRAADGDTDVLPVPKTVVAG